MRGKNTLAELSSFVRFVLQHPSRINNRVGAFGRFLLRQTHQRIYGGPLIVAWEGLELHVEPNSTSAAAAYYLGRPDWWEFDFVERFLRPGDTAIDVGANVGVYSLFMAKMVGPTGTIIACEPDPENAAALYEHLQCNQLGQVQVVQAAIGEEEGTVGFLAGQRTVSRICPDADAAPSRVRLTTLDDLSRGFSPVFVKVDVEGFEDGVVRGARTLMTRGLPKAWQLEIDPRRIEQTARLGLALGEFGYRSFTWNCKTRILQPQRPEETTGNNLLAIADINFVRSRLAEQ